MTLPHSAPMRPFASLILAPRGDGMRRRSGTDLVRVLGALVLVSLLGLAYGTAHRVIVSLTVSLHPPPHSWSWLFTWLWVVGSVGTIVLLVAIALIARRAEIIRDLATAIGIALGFCLVIRVLFGADLGFPETQSTKFVGVNLDFPTLLLATAAAAGLVALPYLSRNLRRLFEATLIISILTGLVHGAGLPFSLLASVIVGWGAAASTHLVFGSPTGIPSVADVTALLGELAVSVEGLTPAPRQDWGLARFVGIGPSREQLRVSLYGRDAQESQLFAKLYRTIFLRQDVGPFALTRTQQLEHEGYLTLLASSAAPGGTSTMVTSGIVGPSNDALVVSASPQGATLADLVEGGVPVTDAHLKALADGLGRLRSQRIVHGSIDLNHVVIASDAAVFVDFDRGVSHASQTALDHDVAALMVVLALAADSKRAVAAALASLGPATVAAALPYLQDVALPSGLTSVIRRRHSHALLKELREAGATGAGVDIPKLAELHRVSWVNLILAVGTLIGAWALIGVLLHVAQAASTLAGANWFWVAMTAIVSQVAYLGSAFAALGSITSVIPLGPLIALELSNTFSGLALGSPAVLAARVRFFQKHGIDTTIAVSSGVLVSTASWIVKGSLFLVSIPFAIGTIHFSALLHPSNAASSSGATNEIIIVVVIVLAVIGVLIGAVFMVPRLRSLAKEQILPRVGEVVSHFKVLAGRPAKILEIFGGMLLAQLVIALALSASLAAFGEHLSLPVILVVLTIGSMLGGVSPVPGGMGVVEAGMILSLKAAGIPDDVAVAAVFVQRLFTAYLPPIAGWFALMWLRRKEYL